jgi:hypothetical protein
VAEIGWTHRASFSPGGRKACWGRRALAGKKSVAPPDAGARMERRRTGARVEGSRKKLPTMRPVGLGSQVHDTMEGVLGLLPVLLSPAGRSKNPSGSQVKLRVVCSARGQVTTDSRSGGYSDSDSGVPAGDEGNVRGRHDSVKALQGSKRPRGVRILDAQKASVSEVRRIAIGRS